MLRAAMALFSTLQIGARIKESFERSLRQAAVIAVAVVVQQRVIEIMDVGAGGIQASCAGRRHDMSGVAGEKQPAVAHGLDDDATVHGDPFL